MNIWVFEEVSVVQKVSQNQRLQLQPDASANWGLDQIQKREIFSYSGNKSTQMLDFVVDGVHNSQHTIFLEARKSGDDQVQKLVCIDGLGLVSVQKAENCHQMNLSKLKCKSYGSIQKV